MTVNTVLCDQTRGAGCLRKHPLLHLAAVSLVAAQVIPNAAWAWAQPVPPLFLGPAPQFLPVDGRGLEGGLDEIMRERLVAAGQHAGVLEDIPGMGPEACF